MPREMQGRVDRLIAASIKIKTRIEQHPEHPYQPLWRARLAEYELSLGRLANGIPEEGASGAPVGVEINVPVDLFKIEAHPPS